MVPRTCPSRSAADLPDDGLLSDVAGLVEGPSP